MNNKQVYETDVEYIEYLIYNKNIDLTKDTYLETIAKNIWTPENKNENQLLLTLYTESLSHSTKWMYHNKKNTSQPQILNCTTKPLLITQSTLPFKIPYTTSNEIIPFFIGSVYKYNLDRKFPSHPKKLLVNPKYNQNIIEYIDSKIQLLRDKKMNYTQFVQFIYKCIEEFYSHWIDMKRSSIKHREGLWHELYTTPREDKSGIPIKTENIIKEYNENKEKMNKHQDKEILLPGYNIINNKIKNIWNEDELKKIPGATKIGDTWTSVPPQQLRVSTSKGIDKIQTIRTHSSMKIKTGKSQIGISMTIIFPTLDSINGTAEFEYRDGLRAILAQFKRTPLIPIWNKDLSRLMPITMNSYMKALNIIKPGSKEEEKRKEAIKILEDDLRLFILSSISISTIPDFPESLVCELDLLYFNHSCFFKDGSLKFITNGVLEQELIEKWKYLQYRNIKFDPPQVINDGYVDNISECELFINYYTKLIEGTNTQSKFKHRILSKYNTENFFKIKLVTYDYDIEKFNDLMNTIIVGNSIAFSGSIELYKEFKNKIYEKIRILKSVDYQDQQFKDILDKLNQTDSDIQEIIGEEFYKFSNQTNQTNSEYNKKVEEIRKQIQTKLDVINIPQEKESSFYGMTHDSIDRNALQEDNVVDVYTKKGDNYKASIDFFEWKSDESVVIKSLTFAKRNITTPLPLLQHEYPIFQHMGSMDSNIIISFECNDIMKINLLKKIDSDLSMLLNQNKQEQANTWYRIYNPFTAMCGFNYGIIEAIDIQNIEGEPGRWNVMLNITEFDISQLKRERVIREKVLNDKAIKQLVYRTILSFNSDYSASYPSIGNINTTTATIDGKKINIKERFIQLLKVLLSSYNNYASAKDKSLEFKDKESYVEKLLSEYNKGNEKNNPLKKQINDQIRYCFNKPSSNNIIEEIAKKISEDKTFKEVYKYTSGDDSDIIKWDVLLILLNYFIKDKQFIAASIINQPKEIENIYNQAKELDTSLSDSNLKFLKALNTNKGKELLRVFKTAIDNKYSESTQIKSTRDLVQLYQIAGDRKQEKDFKEGFTEGTSWYNITYSWENILNMIGEVSYESIQRRLSQIISEINSIKVGNLEGNPYLKPLVSILLLICATLNRNDLINNNNNGIFIEQERSLTKDPNSKPYKELKLIHNNLNILERDIDNFIKQFPFFSNEIIKLLKEMEPGSNPELKQLLIEDTDEFNLQWKSCYPDMDLDDIDLINIDSFNGDQSQYKKSKELIGPDFYLIKDKRMSAKEIKELTNSSESALNKEIIKKKYNISFEYIKNLLNLESKDDIRTLDDILLNTSITRINENIKNVMVDLERLIQRNETFVLDNNGKSLFEDMLELIKDHRNKWKINFEKNKLEMGGSNIVFFTDFVSKIRVKVSQSHVNPDTIISEDGKKGILPYIAKMLALKDFQQENQGQRTEEIGTSSGNLFSPITIRSYFNEFLNNITGYLSVGSLGYSTLPGWEGVPNAYVNAMSNLSVNLKEQFYTSDKTLHLARCFPTFKLYLIEEDPGAGLFTFNDDFYSYSSVESIDFIDNKDEPAGIAVIKLTNISGNLTNEQALGTKEQLFIDDIASEQNLRSWFIAPGTRVQLRMGYDAHPMELPTILNGRVSECSPVGDMIEIIVSGDGIQLTKILDYDPGNCLNGSKGTPPGAAAYAISEACGDEFGKELNRGLPLSISAIMNKTIHIKGREETTLRIGFDWLKNYLASPRLENFWWNFYASPATLDFTKDFYIYNKTAWEIINEALLMSVNKIAVVRPFDDRSTIYVGPEGGKYQFTSMKDYSLREQLDIDRYRLLTSQSIDWENLNQRHKILENVKEFKPVINHHYVNSFQHIIDNSIRVTDSDVYNKVSLWGTGTNILGFERIDSQATTDKDEYNIETVAKFSTSQRKSDEVTFYATTNNGENESQRLLIATNILRKKLENMYTGELILVGDGNIKKNDIIHVSDYYNGIFGAFKVAEVRQHMSKDTGFITVVKPACITSLDIGDEETWGNWTANEISNYITTGGIIGGMIAILGVGALTGGTGSAGILGTLMSASGKFKLASLLYAGVGGFASTTGIIEAWLGERGDLPNLHQLNSIRFVPLYQMSNSTFTLSPLLPSIKLELRSNSPMQAWCNTTFGGMWEVGYNIKRTFTSGSIYIQDAQTTFGTLTNLYDTWKSFSKIEPQN